MKLLFLTIALISFNALAFESFQYENKGSSSATEILLNSSLDLGVKIEGDSAKAIYLKIENTAICESEDATSTFCKKVGKSISCSRQTNSRGDFYNCSFLVNKQGVTLPQKL